MPEQCVCRAHARCNVRHPPAISMLTSGRGSCVVYGVQSHLATAVCGLFEGGLRVCGCENASTASLGSFAGCAAKVHWWAHEYVWKAAGHWVLYLRAVA